MAGVDFDNPNLDGDFKALLRIREERKIRPTVADVQITSSLPEKSDDVTKKKTKIDEVRELLFQAAKTNNLKLLEDVVRKLPDYNLSLSDPSLRDPETRATALHVALELGSTEVARSILDQVTDDDYLCATYDVPVKKTTTTKTALHLLADGGDATLMEEFLRRVDDRTRLVELLHETTLMAVAGQRPRDFAAIHIAALSCNTAALDVLVRRGVDVDLTNKKEDTAALWAARANGLATMRRLIELGADVDHKNDKGSTPLHWAVRYGFGEMVRLLATEGRANVDGRRKLGLVSPIVLASALGYAPIVQMLLSLGADVDTRITYGQTALQHAASSGLDDVVDVLLKRNADVDAGDDQGTTPLHMAAKNGHLSTMRLLCSHGASITCRDKFGKTAWSYAMEADGLGVIDVVVGVHERRTGGTGGRKLVLPVDEAPLHEAARMGDLEKIRYLIGRGCDPLAVDAVGNTFFHVAAGENRPRILDAFRSDDVVNEPNADGDIPIHLAARRGHTDVIRILLKTSRLDAANRLGYTALHEACAGRQVPAEAVAVLVKGMVDDNNWSLIDAADQRGNTALHLAAVADHADVIGELRLLNPSLTNADGDNPLHAAAKRANSAVLAVMFEIFNAPGKGLDLEQENADGESVLHVCSKVGSVELVNELIATGADLARRNKQGNTILHEMAEEMSINPECAETLLAVYKEVVRSSAKWWCIRRDLAHPEEKSDAYVDYKRRSMIYLTSDVYNLDGYNVLAYCAMVGALPLFRAIMATEDVYLLSKGKQYVYDVTNVTPSTCVGPSRRRKSNAFSRAAVDPLENDEPEEGQARAADRSYLDVVVDMRDEVLATKFLDVVPVKQLSDNLWGGYQWIYIILMIVHIVYMSSLSAMAIAAAGIPFNTTAPPADQQTGPARHFPFVFFLSWPLIISLYQTVTFFIQMKVFVQRQRTAKSDDSSPTAGAAGCRAAIKAGLALFRALVPSLSGATALSFSAVVFAWYAYYATGRRDQVYFLSAAMILGWMLTIAFTKGFRSVHAFSTMLFYIIVRDVTRFLTIYIFVLVGFSLAMHALFQISATVAAAFSTPWHTIFLAFNLMLGVADLFDDEFDGAFQAAGSTSLWVKLVYVLYMILATIVMLNLLIAMLSDTYNEIKRKEGSTWRVNSLRMALRIENGMPLLKRMATRLSLVDVVTQFDDPSGRWLMRISADRTSELAGQSVSEISDELKRLELEISSMRAGYRGIQEQLDAVLDHLEPQKTKARAKSAARRRTPFEKT